MDEKQEQITAIVPRPKATEVALPEANNLWKLGQAFFRSGLFPNVKNEFGAMAIIELGRELGLAPMVSLNAISIIEGRPSISGQAMLAMLERAGIGVEIVEKNKQACRLTFTRPGKKPWTETFTMADAAQIKDKSGKPLTQKTNYLNFPEEMCLWRCLAKGARAYAADVVMSLYAKEEMDAAVVAEPPVEKPAAKPKPQPRPKVETPEDRKVGAPAGMNKTFKPEERHDLDDKTPDEVRQVLITEITSTVGSSGIIEQDFLGWLFFIQADKKRKWVTKEGETFTLQGGKIEDIAFLAQKAVITAAIAVFKDGMRAEPKAEEKA